MTFLIAPRGGDRPAGMGYTLRRDTTTVNDPEIGGGTYDVSYAGETIGVIRSHWGSEGIGIYWTASPCADYLLGYPEGPCRYTDSKSAAHALMRHKGWIPAA